MIELSISLSFFDGVDGVPGTFFDIDEGRKKREICSGWSAKKLLYGRRN